MPIIDDDDNNYDELLEVLPISPHLSPSLPISPHISQALGRGGGAALHARARPPLRARLSRRAAHAGRGLRPHADPGATLAQDAVADGIKDHKTDNCIRGIQTVDSVLSSDEPSSVSGDAFSDSPYIKMLREYKPLKGVLLAGRKSTNRSTLHFPARLRDPVPCSRERKKPLKFNDGDETCLDFERIVLCFLSFSPFFSLC